MAGLLRKQNSLSYIIFLTALILRLVNLIEISVTKPFYKDLLIDAKAYDIWGRQIAGGEIIGKGIFNQDPLYPYFLGLIYSIFGHNIFAVLILQSIVGAASTLFVYLIGSKLINKNVGLIAALLWAFHPTIIFYEGLLMKEGLAVFLVLLSIYGITIARESQKNKHWCFAGITLGLSALTRGNILLFVPFVLLWLLFDDRMNFIKFSLAFIAGLLIVFIPVAARNKFVGGEYVLTTSQAGANFYWGNNEGSTGTILTSPAFVRSKPPYEKEDFTNEAMRLAGRALSDTGISRFWFKKGVEFIFAHPKQYFTLLFQKLLLLFNDEEISDNYQYYYYKRYSTVLQYSPVSYGLLCSFGLLGMVLSAKKWRKLLPLYLFAISYSVSLLMFLISTRYRLPIVPVFAIFAALALSWIWEQLRKKAFVKIGYALAVFVFLSSLVWKDISWVSHWNMVDVLALEASELFDKGEVDAAETKFREVIKLSPMDYDGHLGLGEIYFKKRRYLEAVDEFKTALREEPRSALLYSKIGFSYIYAGELDKGIEAFYKAIELRPDQISSYYGLSIAYGEKGSNDESQKYLNEYNRHKSETTDF